MSVSIPQTGPEAPKVMNAIQEFLNEHGIKSHLGKNYSAVRLRNGRIVYSIHIANQGSIRKVLEGMFPYLIIKKVAAQDFLRYLKLFPGLFRYKSAIREGNGNRFKVVRGEQQWGTHLKEADVIQIRVLLALKLAKQQELANRFNIAQTAISAIKLKKSWKHLLPFIGDNSAYQQYYPSQQLTVSN